MSSFSKDQDQHKSNAFILTMGKYGEIETNNRQRIYFKIVNYGKIRDSLVSSGLVFKAFFVMFLSVKEPPGGDAVDDDLSWPGLTQTLGMTVEKLRN